VVEKSSDKIAKEAFTRCLKDVYCADQMLDDNTLYFANKKYIIDNEDYSEEMTKFKLNELDLMINAYPEYFKYAGYLYILGSRQKCYNLMIMQFDQKCLSDNLWRDDYNFTLLFNEYNALE
jgi:hypothetical protein